MPKFDNPTSEAIISDNRLEKEYGPKVKENIERLKLVAKSENIDVNSFLENLKRNEKHARKGVDIAIAWHTIMFLKVVHALSAPLRQAFNNRDTKQMEAIIRAGVNLNEKDIFGRTVLHDAVTRGRYTDVVRLVVARADLEVPDENGETALHAAAKAGNYRIVRFLIVSGAKSDAKSSQERTPMQLAAEKGHVEVASFLSDFNTEFKSYVSDRKFSEKRLALFCQPLASSTNNSATASSAPN